MQSFLGSLNYYSRFIEDFAIYASVLYELREADFHEICRLSSEDVGIPVVKSDNKCQYQEKNRGCGPDYKSGGDPDLRSDLRIDLELRPELGSDHITLRFRERSRIALRFRERSRITPRFRKRSKITLRFKERSRFSPRLRTRSTITPRFQGRSRITPRFRGRTRF